MSQRARIDMLSRLRASDPKILRRILAGFLLTGAAANIAGCFLVGPCLDVGPCLSQVLPDMGEGDMGDDMSSDMEEDFGVSACLTAPPPDMEVGPCLGALPPDMGEDMGEDMPITPCLDVPPPDMGMGSEEMGSLERTRQDETKVAQRQQLLEKLSGRLPADVVAKLQAHDPKQS